MLWSLVKILSFVAMVMLISYGAGRLMEARGGVMIQYAGLELSFGALQAALLVLGLLVTFWLVLKLLGLVVALLRFINGDETALSRYFDRNRERRGFEALSDGLMALASGDGRDAMAKAKKADRLLNRPDLTNLIMAQAAVANGDRQTAKATYKKLLKDPKTRFVGTYGLLQQHLQDGDTEVALKLAEHAFALKPRHGETQDVLLKLQAGQEDWRGVRTTLTAKLKHGTLPKDVHKRRDAVFALSQSRDLRAEGKLEEAQTYAVEANRLAPGLVPAALLSAEGHREQKNVKQASRILRAAWQLAPHPDLAAGFAALVPDEAPAARLKRFGQFTKGTESHPETKMLMAELYVALADFDAARRALGDLAKTDHTMRALTILAAIERGDGADDQSVRQLLTQAISAQRDPQWICDNCGHVHHDWEPVCLNCEAIDSITWKRPPMSEAVSPDMLPLIVGHMARSDEDFPPLLEPEDLSQADASAAKIAANDAPLKE
ncbi:Lipopolysaccharide assembly protein B [Rhodobacteraceae bacterium IMCC1933]|nr:Lipopolysaccharide assembly protein B [Rhodobacteraceae bacterium IMCC1923]MDP4066567.1 Lipopolysaccharide assembly protein B [Rhodobacteraceae bacterium IMCC1933]MDP4072367.1 Lipopolysaccharide assembly protein B [Rhodobacteraceae bacterium IMCC1909]